MSLDDPLTVPGLAEALRNVTITGVFYCPSTLTEPWGLTLPPMPGCLWFHALTSGRCRLFVEDQCLDLVAGDLVLVPHGTGHRIEGGEPRTAPIVLDLPHDDVVDNYAVLRYGGGGAQTEAVCGGLRLEHPIARRVVDALPPIVHVGSTRSRRSAWIGATLDLLADEVGRRGIGSEAVISRLCDIVVIQAIRSWVASAEATGSRWLTAMSDPQIGPALAAMHRTPAARWTVSSLAAECLMSRSAFSARFSDLVGRPVMRYLTELRMQLAVDLFRQGGVTVAEVAAAVGYESDASFSRVFKRVVGTTPRAIERTSTI